MKKAASSVLAMMLALAASPALAQQPAPSGARPADSNALQHGYVSVNGGYQATSNTFTGSWSVPYYLENESVTANYTMKPAVLFDAGGGVRVWRNLVAGVAVSWYHRSDPAAVTATVPYPLLYSASRSFSQNVSGPERTELAVHPHVMWVIPASSRIQVGVFGGPSVYSVKQTEVSGLTFAEAYPYTTLTLASATTRSQTTSRIGFNAGFDVTVLLHRQIGVGMLLRYTGMTAETPPPTTSPGRNFALAFGQGGGLQVGAGVRLRF